jgi:hypothetical protein
MINRAVYSFWTKPQSKSKELLCGFNSTEAFLDCLHLSVIFSKKWFKEVVMVTDLEGKKIIEKAKIPFDSITTELEDIKAKACFQNFEANDQYHAFYRPQCKEATKDKLDIGIRYDIEIGETIAVNCGIMAFNEIGFLQELYDKALKFIDWHDTKNFPMWDLSSIVFEQMHLYQILLKRNIMPDVLATFFVDDNLAAELGYTHLISNSKRDEEIEKKVKERLKIELNDKT